MLDGDITVASTTDKLADVRTAAGLPVVEEQEQEQEVEEQEQEQEQPAEEDQEQTEEEEQESEEEEEEQETEEEEEVEEKPVTAKKAKNQTEFLPKSVQKRVSRLTARNYSLEEENASLKRTLESVQRGTKGGGEERKAVTEDNFRVVLPANLKEPQEADFADYKDFVKALAKYHAQVADIEIKQRNAAEEEQARTIETYRTYNRAVSDARGEYDDFDEVVGSEDLFISNTARLAIIDLGNVGPHVAYYLGTHPEECERLAGLTPMQQVMRVGKLAERFEEEEGEGGEAEPARPKPKAKPVTTKAGAPIRPVTAGKGKTKTSVPLDSMAYQDFKKVRQEQERQRFRR